MSVDFLGGKMVSYNIDYIEVSISLISNDIALFSANVKNHLEDLQKTVDEFKKNKSAVVKTRNLRSLNRINLKDLKDDAFILFNNIITKTTKKHSTDIKELYIGSNTPSSITQNPKSISEFCVNFLDMNTKRGNSELSEFVDDVKKMKDRCDEYSKTKLNFNTDKKTKKVNLETSFSIVQEHFKVLKSLVFAESLEDKDINFRFYFPAVKKNVKKAPKSIISEMTFESFVRFSKLPDALKTENIYEEWLLKIKILYFKEKTNETECFIKTDEFIEGKYKG